MSATSSRRSSWRSRAGARSATLTSSPAARTSASPQADVIRDVVPAVPASRTPTRRLSLRRAMRAAKILREEPGCACRFPASPRLPTYTAGILGLSQTYDITAARRGDLGYEPKMTVARGIEERLCRRPGLTAESACPCGSGPRPPDRGRWTSRSSTPAPPGVRPLVLPARRRPPLDGRAGDLRADPSSGGGGPSSGTQVTPPVLRGDAPSSLALLALLE